MLGSLAERSLERLARPLDQLRQALLQACGPLLTPFIRDRALRVNTTAVLGLCVTALLSLKLPLWQLALGPIIWGVPHIIGDLRYLVLKQGLARAWGFWLLIATPLAYYSYQPRVTTTMLGVGGAGVLGLLTQRASAHDGLISVTTKRRLLIVAALGALGYWVASEWPKESHYALLHGHNLITLGLWWWWRPRQRWEALSLVTLIGLSALILFGWEASEWRADNPREGAWGRLTMSYFEVTLAGVAPREWRPQWVALYGFLQSAHYLVWVRLIPEDDRERETPVTFRRSVARLSQDFGGWVIALTLLMMVGLGAWAVVDVAGARLTYLTWISAHASLEIALIAYLFVSQRSLRQRKS